MTLPRNLLNTIVLAGVLGVCGEIVHCRADDDTGQKARILLDWLEQDCGPAAKKCFSATDNCDLERQAVATVLKETSDAQFRAELTKLTDAKTPGNDPRWRSLYVRACEARRAARLGNLIREAPKIAFTKHYNLGGSHYAYTEGQSDAQAERHFVPGAALCVLDLKGDNISVSTLIDDPDGVIRDPAVSYDGKRILFAWKKSDREDDYHLYEIEVATRKIRQLTSGLGFADYEGCYLPNGDIIFTSTRCVQIVDCWWTEVSNLYTCNADGEFLRRISFDQVHSNYPQVLPDGRVVYTRWDYNDRGQLYPQPLFQMNSDGTGQTEYYGNNSWFPTTIAHARSIPGSDKLIAIATGHHCIQTGALIVIDAKKGSRETSGVTLVAPLVEDKSDRRYRRVDAYTGFDGHFGYPFAINEREYLASYSADETRRDSKNGYGLYYVREDGARELLVDDPEISCNQPVPLAARPTPVVRPSAVDYRQSTGTYYVQDVYVGPGLKGVPRGTVKKLRVVALDFRAAGVGSNRNGGPAGGALVSTPVSIRNGTWDVKTVLGETPVYGDGSALFEVPARTPLFFQAVDGEGRVVQSMRSWSTLQPGETFSCVGCHEDKNSVGGSRQPTIALAKGPKKLNDFYGKPRGFSFAREVQPILNKHCIECHDDRAETLALAVEPNKRSKKDALKDASAILPIQSTWKYTTDEPGEDWRTSDFNDGPWKAGKAGFGSKGTPSGKARSEWKTPDIWLRTTFKLADEKNIHQIALAVHHDEDVEIYLNGVMAAAERGYLKGYELVSLSAKARASLRAGRNTLAVHCRQTSGGQFIDVGIYQLPQTGAGESEVAGSTDSGDPALKKAFSLLSETASTSGGREWSDAYIALTQNGKPNSMVNWLNVQSVPPMLPPYFAGSAKSELMALLRKGQHYDVELSREELDKIACWIDLLVPFCGDYMEANAWTEQGVGKYTHFLEKRKKMEAIERANIEALLRHQLGVDRAGQKSVQPKESSGAP